MIIDLNKVSLSIMPETLVDGVNAMAEHLSQLRRIDEGRNWSAESKDNLHLAIHHAARNPISGRSLLMESI